ncbi:hypothetical protein C8R44DRAFT_673971 [Mycena epipterygia]|nr:hypothetical protein C8R44DRAFT_673971 [Mycena epipterygia]
MSITPSPLSPKRTPKATPATATDGDHRKRRRNRTTQSCLNCHATKRMCDRKRPCSRCSQLGLTGNCVYEVDDPSRQGQQDESTRLMGRIAELEGVIRELKNKPHPRWMAEHERTSSGSEGHPSPPSSGGASTPNVPAWAFPSSPRYRSPGFPPSFHAQAPIRSPSYDTELESLLAAYAGLTDHMYIRRGGHCGCLNEAACYTTVLELSLRLRKAADVLARSPSHSNNSTCALNAQIAELDMLVKNSLLNFSGRPNTGSSGSSRGMGEKSTPPPIFGQHYSIDDTTFSWDLDDFSGADDFMSWAPPRGNM